MKTGSCAKGVKSKRYLGKRMAKKKEKTMSLGFILFVATAGAASAIGSLISYFTRNDTGIVICTAVSLCVILLLGMPASDSPRVDRTIV